MIRKHILEALRNGEIGLDEARRAVRSNGSRHGGSKAAASVRSKSPIAASTTSHETLDRLQKELAKSLAAALYVEEGEIDLDLNFKDMGLDSIVGVEWINQIKRQYGIKIPATKVYDYPTILKFADYLHGVLKEAGRLPASRVNQVLEVEAPVSLPDGDSQPSVPRRPASPSGSIAIVGMSGRYPDAPDLARFWKNLEQGRNSIREIPRERWDTNNYYDPDPSKPGKIYCKWLGALDAIDCFDAPFFMISPVEAETMDPQYRIFIEEAYRAFEDAGYSARSLSNRKCGVYMGVMNSEYVHLLASHQAQGLNTGNSHSIAAARISYFLNLKGPAIPIDTACSSSLVATHLACQALRNGEIEMALVGGVTLYLTPASFIGMCAAGMLSPDGQCKSFDDGANGFVPGEGAGALVLKRLEDAQRDHDCIHGVILGSGINQDGRTNGITAPSVQSQVELERDVYKRFGIDPATIDYIETHGTGTKLGDPVELEALTTVFRERTKQRAFCGLGSVKSNIGHTSAAAGMAGMHKMLLCFKHQALVPSLNFQKANVHCDFEDSPFYINTATKPWPARADKPRRAAVSSMGFSGTNAHVVIEEYLGPAGSRAGRQERGPYLILLSSKNEARLAESARQLHAFLKSGVRLPAIRDLAYTLQVGRDAMEERLALLVDSLDDLTAKLGQFLEGRDAPDLYRGRVQRSKGKLALHEPDEMMAKVIAAWIARRHWGKLLEHWVAGLIFDWSRLYADDKPYRASLPTYPFARERYWVKSEATAGQTSVVDTSIQIVSATGREMPPARDRFAKPSGLLLNAPESVVASFDSADLPPSRPRVALEAFPPPKPAGTAAGRGESRRVLKTKDVLDDLKSAAGGDGRMVPTLNRTGVMLEKLTPTSLAFARYAGQCRGEVLDMGCAYGVATIAALEAGASVLAADMEPQHLKILEDRIEPGARSRLRVQQGILPQVDFEKDRFAAIHAARVIHFLRPDEVRLAIRKMADWLQPGGCLFLVSDTPYVGYWKSKADEYEARKARGDLWPGYIDDVRKHFGRHETDGAPSLINALDPDILRRECEAAGFLVEQSGFEAGEIGLGHGGAQPQGREHAGLIARKPVRIGSGATASPAAGADETDEGIRRYLRQSLAEALHSNDSAIDEEMRFIELGVDSIIAVTWVRGINTRYGLSIGATRIYDYPCVREFADFLKREMDKLGTTETPARPARAPESRSSPRPYGLVLSKAHAFAELELGRWNVPPPAASEVTVQVRASAVGFTDAICVKGLYPATYPFVPGLEVAGVVSSVGAASGGIRIGDEVIALTSARMGGHAEYVNVPASHVVPKPPALSFEEACSLPLAFGVAYYALEQLGGLSPQEHVLIQTATGGCGLMALQLARLKGCVCYGTSSRDEKRDLLKRLGVPHVLDYKSAGFAQEIRELSEGRGMDVVLNTLAGDAIQQGLNCLAPSGRYLELATHALMTAPRRDLSPLPFNQSIQVVAFLELLSRPDGKAVRELLDLMAAWAESGKIVPTVSRVYPLHRIAEALEYVSNGRHVGKVVISHTSDVMEDRLDACVARLAAQKRLAESAGALRPERVSIAVGDRAPAQGKGPVERVAIVGMSGRFPKAPTLAAFWENLLAGRDCISEIPASRWPIERFYDPDAASPGKTCCKWMGVLEEVDRFDPLFFQISPAEARLMDPQQRLFIESCWSCLEDAAINPRSLSGANCGVFAGCGMGDYGLGAERGGVIGATGVAPSILPARVSYLLNLKGPCLAIDTSCSSSLVAMANACDSLILGNCDLALAGGVLVMAGPSLHLGMSQGGMLSPQGRCFTFDERANGFVPGEGVGVVLLKRLSDAVRDGDNIHAVIQGWGMNQDGKTNGITAPSMNSQAALEEGIYTRFGVNPETISLVEAHGTGTRLGDPIEVEALTKAFRAYTRKQAYCALGSVKSNIGHLGVAAGIAGVLKVLLAIRHRAIPPTVHFEKLNQHIPLEGSPFYISQQAHPWESTTDGRRRAIVSSFGFSGTNAHVVIEEPPPSKERPLFAVPAIIVLSAKTGQALQQAAQNLCDFLSREPESIDCSVHDIAYTLQVGREAMEERLGLIVESREELKGALGRFLEGRKVAGLYRDQVKRNKEAMAEFRAADKSLGRIDRWIEAKDYSEILKFWAKGLDFDWDRLYQRQKPRRVSLPGYPFARERYWLDEPPTPDRPREENEAKAAGGLEIFMARPVWKEWKATGTAAGPEYDRHIVFLDGFGKSAVAEVRRRLTSVACIPFASEQSHAGKRFGENARQVFETVKDILGQKPLGKTLIQVLLRSADGESSMTGLSGLLKTARLENPTLVAQVIETDTEAGGSETLLQFASRPELEQARGCGGKWTIPSVEELPCAGSGTALPWKENGVYLITGGGGGLGLIFAGEIAAKAVRPVLILAGRSPLDSGRNAALKKLEFSGAKVVYRQVDVADAVAVSRLVKEIQAEHGVLDGVIHAAGVIRDNFIIKKSASEFTDVLAPKVLGAVNLDLATKDLPLDFFALFSSGAGVTGNAGQADYAAANAFMDAFAVYRSGLVGRKQRQGKTVSINWPLWKEGGMRVDPTVQQTFREATGMAPMETPAGRQAFYRALAAGVPQIWVVAGDVSRIRQGMLRPRSNSAPGSAGAAPLAPAQAGKGKLQEKTLLQLKLLLGEIIELPAVRIESDEPLERYGIDSVMVTRLNQQLRRVYPEASQTLFFEFQNLAGVATHLADTFPSETARWTKLDQEDAATSAAQTNGRFATHEIQLPGTAPSPGRAAARARSDDSRPSLQEPIAIIGICGRYAQADTLDAFWENLKSGQDCVTEIPPERWALEGFFHGDPEEAIKQGKSYSKWGSFLGGFAEFDPLFFNISPLEAMGMDPQERLFLQSCWEVLETAGYTRTRLAETIDGDVGVFAGITKTGFDQYRSEWRKQGEAVSPYTSFGSVANRVSYVLNLKGPSMPIDTMCSSSLTAIHEACEQLRRGSCRMAIAGGVNLYLHPSSYVGLCAQRMLSKDGSCKSFGEGGDGFVPGEGVGTVLLKPLAQAREDGDPIHAIIRGTSVNHGGKTNGYTVPNPNAQRAVIREALDKAGIDARSVSYIEAHGTGTELGDPIEVTGLTQAFAKDTPDTCFCALGSAKSNLGHLEAAAGIAGLTKVVLQMKHGKIAPSLHAGALNPKINFSKTPFVVQQELADWKRPVFVQGGETTEYPRIAGISSFGAGGANAHVVIEEPPPMPASHSGRGDPALIVISARTEERLHAYARKTGNFLSVDFAGDGLDLHDLAFSLQVGREAMEERAAFIVSSVPELRDKLAAFLEKPNNGDGVFRGRVRPGEESLGEFYGDEDMAQTIATWLRKGKLARIAELWVRGGRLDWEKLHGDNLPRRIGLPTYPFAREKYWVEIKPVLATGKGRLHPMVHSNTSDLSGLRFSSYFSGDETFIADHVVKGEKVLPGVAYLEMARFAARQAAGTSSAQPVGTIIRNVVWARPISVNGPGTAVHLRLFAGEETGISFSIETDGDGGEPLVCSQGLVAERMEAEAPALDLARLRAEIADQHMDRRRCYETFASMGVHYGPGYQGIEEVAAGAGQVLARLALPASLAATRNEYLLHPSLLDSSLQACLGLSLLDRVERREKPPAFVPYALDEAEIFGPCADLMWAWIRPSRGDVKETIAPKLDIDLCDENGLVRVSLRGLSFRKFETGANRNESDATLMMSRDWLAANVPTTAASVDYSGHLVLMCGLDEPSLETAGSIWPEATCRRLMIEGEGLEQRFESASTQAFELVRELLGSHSAKGKRLVQIVIPSDAEGLLFGGLAGLLKTAHLENPDLMGQVIAVERRETQETLWQKLKENSRSPEDIQVRYAGGVREVVSWREEPDVPDAGKAPWKDGGVYLIAGGAGGLGLIFAEAIARQTKDATLILCGRSDLSQERPQRFNAIDHAGAKIIYRKVDISRRADVEQMIAGIRKDFGKLNGIFHSAGVIRDHLIVNKSTREFRDVLQPKVAGAVYLDLASRDIGLDFFVLFSAGAGVLGNPGQADYATANAFLDEFAQYRNKLVVAKQRRGATLAVDWPLWEEGGMKVDATAVAAMKEKLGMTPMDAGAGIAVLQRALASGKNQLLVLHGDGRRLRSRFSPENRKRPTEIGQNRRTTRAVGTDDSREEKAIDYFRRLLSSTLRVPLNRIQPDGSMSDLGIDSIVVMNLTNRLEENFGSLSKTLFFEYRTVRALARYFAESRAEKLGLLLESEGMGAKTQEPAPAPAALPPRAQPPSAFLARTASNPVPPTASRAAGPLDIAIIGMSGRYPQARNLDEYWQVLRDGRDCITEVPPERWDWRDYYSEDPAQAKGHSSKWGGFISDVDKFDPQFFNISPRIAPYVDPQERLILEEAWKALEDAGYRREDFQQQTGDEAWSAVGVYIGAMYGEYQLFGAEASLSGRRLGFAGNLASIANRLSYVLNLNGPSMMVDTMCSSSLTCLHLACQDLAAGRTNYGIAGGVNVTIHPNKYLMLSGGQFLSASGRCESFGEGGAGYIPSEGVGVVLLKRLADAERDGDHIHGVIRGSAVNHGGRTHGYSVPNPKAQEQVIVQALREARIDPRTVSYIEAHGTGTKLGDPIEIAALAKAFGRQPNDLRCWIGSAKSNIGHCESAAGIAGLTKVLLQMKHRQIAPSLHSRVLNPHIDFAATPFVVNQTLRDWECPLIEGKPGPRIAGLSSFGAGGSNAHLLIEEYVEKSQVRHRDFLELRDARRPALILISAKNEERLAEAARNLHHWLETIDRAAPELLRNLAYTLQVGREAMEERLGLVVSSIEELSAKLDQFLRGQHDIDGLLRGRIDDQPENARSVSTGQAAREAVGEWLGDKNGLKLLEHWARGEEIDWKRLYGDNPPRRISLPTYPFARKRFWVETGKGTPAPEPPVPAHPVSAARARPFALQAESLGAWQADPAEKPRGIALAPLPAASMAPRMVDLAPEHLTPPAPVKSEPRESERKKAPANRAQPAVSQKALQDELLSSLAKALFMEESEISLDKPFLEMGLDSIVGVEWVNAINKKHGLTIPANQVYEYPSLRKFTDFIGRKLRPDKAPPPEVETSVVRPAAQPSRPADRAPAEDPPMAVASVPPERSFTAQAKPRAEKTRTTDIAIVGIAGQFPGGQTLDDFWQLLSTGQTAFTDFPLDRDWDFTTLLPNGPALDKVAAVRKGAFLKEVDRFDPLFFQISPKEAMTMDPGERLFLQESWKAIEDAGIVPADISGRRWGVFCGNGGDYSLRIKDAVGYSPHVTLAQVPSRVSHCLDLTGPSQSIDAGCASALLAIAQACDHLAMGKCEAALAGGVLVHSTPNLIVSASQVDLLAKDGTGGHALDCSASGMVPGEAVGVLLLKPLADALAAGDRIYGVIEGWGNNHNGKTNGMVAPNIEAEEVLFSEVYDRYEIDPDGISFVEANASGLPLADAAEVQALTRAFRKRSARRQFCALGSVENNVGHAFHASGMGHVIKVLLSLKHRQIPATPNVQSPDPALELERSPFFINAETIPWKVEDGRRRRAAVSSFGATGANVHLVIAEGPAPEAEQAGSVPTDSGLVLIGLSAKTAAGLKRCCRDLQTWLQKQSPGKNLPLRRLSANLLLRRSYFEHRCALVVDDLETLKKRLGEMADGKEMEDGFAGMVDQSRRSRPALSLLAKAKIDSLAAGTSANKDDLLVLADLFVQGVTLDMAACFSKAEKAPVSLPTHPFEKRRCWIDAPRKNPSPRPDRDPVDSALAEKGLVESPATLGTLLGFLAEITGLAADEIDPRSTISEYGIDSLLGMRLLNRVNARFGGGFDASLLTVKTIGGMAEEITGQGRAPAKDDGGAPPSGLWVRPAFIESLVRPVATDSAANDRAIGIPQLERLIAHGIGVWREAGALHFEFLEKTQTHDSLERLVDRPTALYAALEEGKRYFPASEMQRFALHESEINRRTTFNLCQGFWFDLPANPQALNAALNDLIQRHSIFRTGARLLGEQWMQVVHDHLALECREIEWPEIDSKERFAAELAKFQQERNGELFDLNRAPLMDIYFVHNGKTLGAVFFCAHHFHADGFTLYLFQQELHRRYLARVRNETWESPGPRAEYAHFALSQFAPERTAVARYWLDKIAGKTGGATLLDRRRDAEEAGEKTGVVELEISPAMLARLQEFNRGSRTTLTQLVAGALAALIYRLTGSNHPIQMVYNLRDRLEFESMLGDFSSSVPMILELDDGFTWREIFQSYEAAMIEIQRHRHFDFSVLLKDGGTPGLAGGVSLDSNDRDAFGEVTDFADRLIGLTMEGREPVVPLLVCVVKTHGRMTVPLIYDRKGVSRRSIELFAENMLALLSQMIRDASTPIRDLEIFPELAQRLGTTERNGPPKP